MKNQKISKTFVTFHIGRGGRFNNSGHLSFSGTDYSVKNLIENSGFIGYENESKIIAQNNDDVADLIADLDNELGDDYDVFCEKYGNLGGLVVKDGGGNEIGDYVEDGEPFRYDSDGDYDTTYGNWIDNLNQLSEEEIEAIIESQVSYEFTLDASIELEVLKEYIS